MNDERHAVKVNIFGSEYVIRGEANEAYIHSLARTVDEKMREIAQNTNLTNALKISILAAINMADEMARLRNHLREKTNEEKLIDPLLGMDIAPEAITALTTHIQTALNEE